MYYHEFCHEPFKRDGTMLPRSALKDIFALPDSGYCSVYAFTSEARLAVKAQKDATGLGRFPVYSDRLWIDLDASNDTEAEKERVKNYARELTRQFQALDYNFTVWDSGSKGFHIAIQIEPMFGKEVPWSQKCFIESAGITCDLSLYQAGRLLSNPGRLHPKTGRKKSLLFQHKGKVTLTIPIVPLPDKTMVDSDSLTSTDLVRIGLSRLSSMIQDPPKAGMRHTVSWSVASQLFEAGLKYELVLGLLSFANKNSPDPKDESEVIRSVDQAANQLGVNK